MPDVVKHAWTHRRRSKGGTDPFVDTGVEWATASRGAQGSATDTYSGGYYWPNFRFLATSDQSVFTPADVGSGLFTWLQLNEPGYYQAWSYISNFSGPSWGTEATSLQTGVLDGAAFTLLSVESALSDFNLEFSRADEKLVDSDDNNSTLFQFNAFHWKPGNGDDLGNLDPLKLAVRILSDGDQGAQDLIVYLHVVWMQAPGYTLIDADDL